MFVSSALSRKEAKGSALLSTYCRMRKDPLTSLKADKWFLLPTPCQVPHRSSYTLFHVDLFSGHCLDFLIRTEQRMNVF